MKRCKKLPEPPLLTAYRAENPDATWDDMRDDAYHDGIRSAQETKTVLVQGQRCLCVFCEISLADDCSTETIQARRTEQRVEHFHPKSSERPPNWDLLWSNLWAVCLGGSRQTDKERTSGMHPLPNNLSCDAFKEHQQTTGQLPLDASGWILAPDEVPAFPRIFDFSPTGAPEPNRENCDSISFLPNQYLTSRELVEKTIEHLNLGCFRLTEKRRIAKARLEKRIELVRKNSPGSSGSDVMRHLARTLFSAASDTPWPEFFTLVRWRLGDVCEDHLKSIGYDG